MRIQSTKLTVCLIILLAVLLSGPKTFAQVQEIPAFTEIVSYITSDTTATGEQNHTTYGLLRGSIYFTLGKLSSDFPLTIVDVGDESLARPQIIVLVDGTGNSSLPFKPFKNLTLEGIGFSGMNSAGSIISELVQTGTTNIKVTFNNCEFDSVRSRVMLVDQNYCSVFVKDCIVHNVFGGNFTGRFIDGRSTLMDSVVAVNSTFYNIQHAVINKFGGWERYVKFDHNTFYNIARSTLKIIECPEVVITNNLFLQTGIVGYELLWKTFYEASDYANSDRDNWVRVELLPMADSTKKYFGMEQKMDFTRNNFWIDPAIDAALPDTMYGYMNLDFGYEKAMVSNDTLTWISEDVNFTKVPECRGIGMSLEARSSGGGSPQVTPGYDYSNPPYDFSYSTTSASYTAAEGGFPLGDLNWFPSKKAEWETYTDVEESEYSGIPSSFSLGQNYPNPFNPTTVINYSIPKNANVVLKVYNILGKEIATLVNGQQSAGSHNISFNASNLASGVYFYAIQADGFSSTKKMMLLK
jgi:hypothetical protein